MKIWLENRSSPSALEFALFKYIIRFSLFGVFMVLVILTAGTIPLLAAGDPVIVAAGDIACDPTKSNFKGGNGTANACHMKGTAQLAASLNPVAVLPLGDTQYDSGTLTEFAQSYDPTWGVLKKITLPVVGNHEYHTTNASGYYSYFGAAAGDPKKGYYSYNIGAWHLIALNSECTYIGGCNSGSPQEVWLSADLAAHPNMCTLAYWHEPRFSSSNAGNRGAVKVFWQDLYAAHADLILNAHGHVYERFALQSPSQAADPNGIREIVVGTGGNSLGGFSTIQPNSQVRNNTTFGVLKVTLHATSYDWEFVPEPGKTFTDKGTQACHSATGQTPTNTPLSGTPTKTPTVTPTSIPVGSVNLLANPGFEIDNDQNGKPDSWSSNSNFTRSNDIAHGGSFSGKHFSTADATYNVTQTVGNLAQGITYKFSGWVNIMPTSDSFTFTLDVRWRDAAGTNLRTDVIKSYSTQTTGWNQASASLVAPANTATAQVRMKGSSLNATIYVDDFSFGR
jgi:hypothetical protein